MHLVIDIFLDCLKSLASISTEDQFRTAVQQQMNTNELFLNHPKSLAGHLSSNAIQWQTPTIYEKNQCLHSLTFADFQEFCRNFISKMRIKALIQGNVTESHALSVMNKMLDELNFKKIDDVSLDTSLHGSFDQTAFYFKLCFLAIFSPNESAKIADWIALFALQEL